MSPAAERRLLQLAVALACLVPLGAGGAGVLRGAAWLGGDPAAIDLQSHVRYLSGLLLAIGIAYATSLPRIERHGARFRLLAAIIVAGGLARLGGLWIDGVPSAGHRFGLVMELGIVPLLSLWQARVAQRTAGAPSNTTVAR